jgi:uncharacterized protein (TIGR00266 family)
MKTELIGSSSFRMMKVTLAAKDNITVESGAMASQDALINCDTKMNGGFLQAIIAKYFGKESFFINHYQNNTGSEKTIYLSQPTPGEIVEKKLINETIFLERGSFIARTGSVISSVVWAGFSSFIGGEGLFKLCFKGTGTIWYGSYGAVIEKDVVGDFIVDSGHLLSYPPTFKLRIKMSGGLFSSFFSGEGFVLRLSGSGKIQLQTRSVKGLAQWLNPRFWG